MITEQKGGFFRLNKLYWKEKTYHFRFTLGSEIPLSKDSSFVYYAFLKESNMTKVLHTTQSDNFVICYYKIRLLKDYVYLKITETVNL
jgi:hypothetical protein